MLRFGQVGRCLIGARHAEKSQDEKRMQIVASHDLHFLAERRAHPPLGAGADMDHGVDIVITGRHGNKAAPSGWMMRLVILLF